MTASKFPRFLELPLELRDEMYRYYFSDLGQLGTTGTSAYEVRPVALRDGRPFTYIGWEEYKISPRTLWAAKTGSNEWKAPRFLPDLCLANKQVGREAARCLVRETQWTIKGLYPAKIFTRVLERALLEAKLFEVIRKLIFPAFCYQCLSGYESLSPYTRIIHLATNLQELQLFFSAHSVTQDEATLIDGLDIAWTGRRTPLPLTKLIEKFRLHPIVQRSRLKKLKLVGVQHSPAFPTRFHQTCLAPSQESQVRTFQTLREFGIWVKEELAKTGTVTEVSFVCLKKPIQTLSPRPHDMRFFEEEIL